MKDRQQIVSRRVFLRTSASAASAYLLAPVLGACNTQTDTSSTKDPIDNKRESDSGRRDTEGPTDVRNELRQTPKPGEAQGEGPIGESQENADTETGGHGIPQNETQTPAQTTTPTEKPTVVPEKTTTPEKDIEPATLFANETISPNQDIIIRTDILGDPEKEIDLTHPEFQKVFTEFVSGMNGHVMKYILAELGPDGLTPDQRNALTVNNSYWFSGEYGSIAQNIAVDLQVEPSDFGLQEGTFGALTPELARDAYAHQNATQEMDTVRIVPDPSLYKDEKIQKALQSVLDYGVAIPRTVILIANDHTKNRWVERNKDNIRFVQGLTDTYALILARLQQEGGHLPSRQIDDLNTMLAQYALDEYKRFPPTPVPITPTPSV